MGEVLVIGVTGVVFAALDLPVAPVLLGYVLAPMVEECFRRAQLLSHGDLTVFFQRSISATIMAAYAVLVLAQLYFWARRLRSAPPIPVVPGTGQHERLDA